jgi:hypothetical protein
MDFTPAIVGTLADKTTALTHHFTNGLVDASFIRSMIQKSLKALGLL